jgi:hypothetical protein
VGVILGVEAETTVAVCVDVGINMGVDVTMEVKFTRGIATF